VSSRRNQTESLAIKHVDPELWRWLKARAVLEGKRQGQLLSELIERYWKEVGWSEENLPMFSPKRNPHPQHSIRGVNRELWEWLKARAKLEGRMLGYVINELIERYRAEVGWTDAEERAAIHPADPEHVVTVKGIDRAIWEHLKEGAELEDKTVGEALNEVIEWYRREVIWP